jgi:LPXTG-motif cell wall-anchored protein
MAIGDGLARSSWIVLGAWGLLQTAEHFAAKWSSVGDFLFFFLPFPFFPFQQPSFQEEGTSAHEWAGPLVFVAAGLLFMTVALFLARRRRDNVPAAGLL